MLLAFVRDDIRAHLLAGPLERFSAATITDAAELEATCAQIREQGWAMSTGERTAGSVAIAVPLRVGGGRQPMALTIFAPWVRFDHERDLDKWLTSLRACAAAAERQLDTADPRP